MMDRLVAMADIKAMDSPIAAMIQAWHLRTAQLTRIGHSTSRVL